MRGREPCAHATPLCRARTRRSVACYWHVLLLAVACIADAGVTATRVTHDSAHTTSHLHGSTTPPPSPTTTPMPSGGHETSGNQTTTQDSGDQGGNDTNATNAAHPDHPEQPASGDTPPPGSEQTCRQTISHIAVQHGVGSQWCACADERGDCKCAGLVRYGDAETSLWAASLWINGTIGCTNGNFGGDPAREKSPLLPLPACPTCPASPL